jgi:hypothetical protein
MAATAQFPNISVPEREKNKEYYESWVRAILTNSFTNKWVMNHNKLKLLYEFFLEGTGSDLTGYLQQAPDGQALPGVWTSINTVKSKLRVLIGELEERGYQIKVKALNSEARDRKYEERERLRVKRILQDVRQYAEELTGIPLEQPEYVPQSDPELDEYINLTWKDKHCIIVEAALKWIAERTDWDETRKRLFYDVLIANMMIVKNDIIRGIPQSRWVDPLKFIFDPNSSDDLLKDSTYFGELEYVPLASAAEQYNLSTEELEEAYKSYQQFLGLGMTATTSSNYSSEGFWKNGDKFDWFKVQDGIPRCLVLKACWRDIKVLKHKDEANDKGVYFQDITKDEKEIAKAGDKVVSTKMECWREATLVAGKFVRNYGECSNQPRELSSLEKTEPPYKVWIPEFFLGKSVSLTEQQVGLSLLKDIAVYKLQLEMAKAVGRVLVLDMALFPDNMSKEQVLAYMKTDGVVFINSKEYYTTAGNTNFFQDYDLSLSQSIAQGISLIDYFDKQLDAISGVSQERQGIVQGASQAVGVTQSSLFQSNLITAPFFKGFERFCSRVLNHQAKLVKIAWAGKEAFAPIIGNMGVDFLRDNIDIQLDEFDVTVKSLPPNTLERQKLEELVMIAVQSDPSLIDMAIDVLLEPDTTVAITRFKRARTQQKKLQMLQEQAAQEQQMAMQQEQMAMQQEEMQAQRMLPLELQKIKNAGNMNKTLAAGRVKLAGQKLNLMQGE